MSDNQLASIWICPIGVPPLDDPKKCQQYENDGWCAYKRKPCGAVEYVRRLPCPDDCANRCYGRYCAMGANHCIRQAEDFYCGPAKTVTP
jgi:hypothetical protein